MRLTKKGWTGATLNGSHTVQLALPKDEQIEDGDICIVKKEGGHYFFEHKLTDGQPLFEKWIRLFEQQGVPLTYDEQTYDESQQLALDAGTSDPKLKDLCSLPFVTIDNADSRDLDQALFIEQSKLGFVVWYALADASYFVKPGSALFDEAIRRGTSYYLPGLSAPMLPRSLSEGVVSLNPDQNRRALVFEMHVNHDGDCVATHIHRARICSRFKLSYRGVQDIYDGLIEPEAEIASSLAALKAVGELRMKLSESKHVVRFRNSEIEVQCGDHALGFQIGIDESMPVERYNEQISLLCNIEGAKKLIAASHEDHVQAIYKVHPSPMARDLNDLAAMTKDLAQVHKLDPKVWVWPGPKKQPLAKYLKQLPLIGPQSRYTHAIDRQARMTNHRSSFQDEPGLHFGIGAPVYARFSAPMREIVGIFTHKELWEALGLASADANLDHDLRERIIKAGNRAKTIQGRLTRAANKEVLDRFFDRESSLPLANRPKRAATVLGLTASKIYLQFDDPPLEIKLYSSDLSAQWQQEFSLSRSGSCLLDNQKEVAIALGSSLSLVVDQYHKNRQRWLFHVTKI